MIFGINTNKHSNLKTVRFVIMSATVAFTGNKSILVANFFPELRLNENEEYSCALLDFSAYNSIANVNDSNNKIYFTITFNDDAEADTTSSATSEATQAIDTSVARTHVDFIPMEESVAAVPRTTVYELGIPPGAYEVQAILDYIKNAFVKLHITFRATVNESTQKVTIQYCDVQLLFSRRNSIHRLLGFNDCVIPERTIKLAENIVNITTLNTIVIQCDIVDGSYINGEKCHAIHQFPLQTEHGYKIIEVPRNIVYLPIRRKRIQSIQIQITVQDGNLFDFSG